MNDMAKNNVAVENKYALTIKEAADYFNIGEHRIRELTDKRDKLGKELSKGMQQKISICCAMLIEPKILLFDEPLVGLDPHAIKELKLMLAEMKEKGTTIIISTHMLDSVEGVWDRVFIMMNGRIEAERTRTQVEESGENLEELFFSITEKTAVRAE